MQGTWITISKTSENLANLKNKYIDIVHCNYYHYYYNYYYFYTSTSPSNATTIITRTATLTAITTAAYQKRNRNGIPLKESVKTQR